MKKWALVFFAVIALAACSKDDGGENNNAVVNGGEAFTSQVISIAFPDAELSQPEYSGTFDGQDIVLMRNDEHTLMFMVSASTPVGTRTLTIPTLDKTINYDVKATVLPGTPAQVMSAFQSNIDTFKQLLGESQQSDSFQASLDSFNEVYENSTPQQQEAFAVYYTANKELFDTILLSDLNNTAGKSIDAETIVILAKHSYGAYLLAGGAIAAILAPGPEKPLAVLVAVAGAVITFKQFGSLMSKHMVTSTVNADGTVGINLKNTNSNGITLVSDVSKTISLKTVDRKVTAADASSSQPGMASFFKDYNRYNYYTGKLNTVITWINDNIIFCNFSTLPLEQVPNTSATVNTSVTSEVFNNITFSVTHPNLVVVSKQFESNGQFKLRVKITGTPASLPVMTNLNYAYTDGFSTFSGTLPLKVSDNQDIDLSGTWSMDLNLGTGICDETIIIDESSQALTFKFNDNNTITFLSDPSGMGLNGSEFTQQYSLDGESLTINIVYNDGSETISLAINAGDYNVNTNTFTGNYTNVWGDGGTCNNTIEISKIP